MEAYEAFVRAKMALAQETGFEVGVEEIHPLLKPHQKIAVQWAIRGGRRALFASFGLGKTIIQLELCRLLRERTHGKSLIVCPLGVRQEFAHDVQMLGSTIQFIRTTAEIGDAEAYITNYESVREGKLDPTGFTVISLDEAAALRSGGASKTFRTMMGYFEGTSTYRYVATAVPSPNDFTELLIYADWLGIMPQSEAKTRWFRRNSEKADHLTLHKAKEEEFWTWCSSWSLFLESPADVCPCGCHEEERRHA